MAEVSQIGILSDASYYSLNNSSSLRTIYEQLSCFHVPFLNEVVFRFLCAAYMARELVKPIAK